MLQLKLGTAKTITDYTNLIHIIKLDSYSNNVAKIEESLKHFTLSHYNKGSLEVTKYKLTDLKNKLNSITPRYRNKRGLFNGKGSAIKFITGNMDSNDASHINEIIFNLTSNVQTETNRQSVLNTKIIERMENITNHINREQDIIVRSLQHSLNDIISNSKLINDIQYLDQINYHIDLLSNHIASISEAMILSRLKIIPKMILNIEELNEIENNLKNQSINIDTIEHLYELLELQAYYNNTNIIFNILHIPHDQYIISHIIPIPINKTKEIIIKPYIIYNNEKIQYFDNLCKKIENLYYCKESSQQETVEKSSCFGKIINHLEANCNLNDVGHITKVSQPEQGLVLIRNLPPTEMKTSCDSKNHVIEGNLLIHFKTCDLIINEITYKDNPNIYWDEFILNPSTQVNIKPLSTIESLSIPKLKEYHLRNKLAIEVLSNNTELHRHINYGFLVAIIGVIIIIVITKRKTKFAVNELPTVNIIPPDHQYFWPSLHTKGGGVIEATATTTTTTTNTPKKPPRLNNCISI